MYFCIFFSCFFFVQCTLTAIGLLHIAFNLAFSGGSDYTGMESENTYV